MLLAIFRMVRKNVIAFFSFSSLAAFSPFQAVFLFRASIICPGAMLVNTGENVLTHMSC